MSKVIEVWHRKEGKFGLVAVVDTSAAHPDREVEDALEYAWRWTNNVDGSWSKGDMIPHYSGNGLQENGDFNESVHVVGELPVHLGREYGIRSSMVGDVFVMVEPGKPNQAHQVAVMGFEPIDWEPARDANRVAA